MMGSELIWAFSPSTEFITPSLVVFLDGIVGDGSDVVAAHNHIGSVLIIHSEDVLAFVHQLVALSPEHPLETGVENLTSTLADIVERLRVLAPWEVSITLVRQADGEVAVPDIVACIGGAS